MLTPPRPPRPEPEMNATRLLTCPPAETLMVAMLVAKIAPLLRVRTSLTLNAEPGPLTLVPPLLRAVVPATPPPAKISRPPLLFTRNCPFTVQFEPAPVTEALPLPDEPTKAS